MKILGIHLSHDSGAAIIEDGKILVAVNEERLLRIKLYWGIPYKSIDEVFRISGVKPEEIDAVAIANITPGAGANQDFRIPNKRRFVMDQLSKMPSLIGSSAFISAYRVVYSRMKHGKEVIEHIRKKGVNAQVEFVEHHECHAAGAFYTAPFTNFKDCIVVTTDSSGDGLCATVNVVDEHNGLKRVAWTPFYHSPASIYSYITFNMGFVDGRHEGKVTGLAAYGDAKKGYPLFEKMMKTEGMQYRRTPFVKGWGRTAAARVHLLTQHMKREDIAAGLQKRFEEVCRDLVQNSLKEYPRKNVCLAGGGFANVRANQVVSEIEGVEKAYIHPHMGDGGLAVGAALGLWARKTIADGRKPMPVGISHAYFGPEYNEEFIENELKRHNVKYQYVKDIEGWVGQLVANKKIVGRFNGRMEYGPRALGNRSILADPTDKFINAWLNKRLNRTEFMPFAPSILRDAAEDYYADFGSKEIATWFMTITLNSTKRAAEEAPAVNHLDNTARPQTVSSDQNQSYYKILKSYYDITRRPLFVNTSFNMHEEAIVCTPDDALRSLKLGAVDVLAIGNFLAEVR
ncbi:MAG TPA: carbamoyltransferase C-terminal domain-containing protein [Candidatus Nanoarchaeia archaeon]|nr:carbamoyltransferase C-terminal domain-containing protein [Candidatus Nanoarchaeia archaeon]